MTMEQFCDFIGLQEEVKRKVLEFAESFDFSTIEKSLKDMRDYAKIGSAHEKIQKKIGLDEDNLKILACLLKASVNTYDLYKERGIPDEIYRATMRCFTRNLEGSNIITGRYYFSVPWWMARLAGGHIFRIGELEYELKRDGMECEIAVHIPRGADFSPKAVDASIEASKQFMKLYFPEITVKQYTCHSWLLSRGLQEVLQEGTNILNFANRFEIVKEDKPSDEFMGYVFRKNTDDYASLPEETSLQRNMKKYLMGGGKIRNAYGIMKE